MGQNKRGSQPVYPLWVIDGLVIGGQRQPLSVVSPIASLAVQCSEGRDVPIASGTAMSPVRPAKGVLRKCGLGREPAARDPFSSRAKGLIAIRMVPVVGWFARVPAYFVGVEDFAEDFAEDLLC